MWVLGIFSFIAYVIVIVHSAIFRGRRITVSFFVFMVLASGLRRFLVEYVVMRRPDGKMPYEFLGDRLVDLGYFVPQEIIGWSLALYLGWSLAELIQRKLGIDDDRVFAIVGWAYLAIGAVAYAVENAAHYAGWWRWSYHDGNVTFFNMPLAGYLDWAGMSFDILLVYFAVLLVLRKRWWAVMLILPIAIQPFVYGAHPGVSRILRHAWGNFTNATGIDWPIWVAFNILMIALVLTAPFFLKTRLPGLRRPVPENDVRARPAWLDPGMIWTASGIIFMVSAVSTVRGTVRSGEIHTAISLLPLLFAIAVSTSWMTPGRVALLLLPLALAFVPALSEWYSWKRLMPVVSIPAYHLATYAVGRYSRTRGQ